MAIHPEAQECNNRLRAVSPTVFQALSPAGLRAFSPKGIGFQAGQSKGCRINATVGQITDGAGYPMPLAPLAEKLAGLDPRDAFLYSPITGREPVRNAWHAKHVKEDARMEAVGLPMVTAGICHALSMAAELFFQPGDTLIIPDLHWDNYEQIFQVSLEGRFASFHFYSPSGGFNLRGLQDALAAAPGRAQVLLNFPSNPSGYSPTPRELAAIGGVLAEASAHRTLVVFCDDAYHGLVFDPGATTRSLFFELLGRGPNLIPLKCDGITKELSFFGGRVGFLTFGVAKEAAALLMEKCGGLGRCRIGSPPTLSQHLAEIELADPRHEGEFERLRLVLAGRYAALKAALAVPSRHWKVLPFNAGCFCLLELRPGLDADAVRQRLIREESVGVVSQGGRYLRVAFCSVNLESIEPLVQALHRVCERS
jgi:aspartate/methionine/tyrosine aminotransferase